MSYLEIFLLILRRHNLKWCKGCNARRGHKRGFVLLKDRTTIHYDSKIATRSTLFGGLHEIGHCVNDERGLRSFECEIGAENFAKSIFKEFGVAIPRERVAAGVDYIKRKKQHGDNIRRSK